MIISLRYIFFFIVLRNYGIALCDVLCILENLSMHSQPRWD